MPKFSIIIPVYNMEQFLSRCLDSVKNQTFTDFEVIVVDDGSTDNSKNVIQTYDFSCYYQKNGGLSSARNYGVTKAKGEYILFLDSDDYLEPNLLKVLSNSLETDLEVLRYQAYRDQDGEIKDYLLSDEFSTTNGEEAFLKLMSSHNLEPAPLYIYQRKYWLKNKFKFSLNKYHEDFGLIPLVILKAKKIKSIAFKGYYYVLRENSITTSNDYEIIQKRVINTLEHYDYLSSEVDKIKLSDKTKKQFCSYLANAIILRINELNKIDKKHFLEELKKRNIVDKMLSDTFKRRIKKILIKIKYNL